MPNITQNRLTKILAFVAIVWLLIALAAPSFLAPALEKHTRAFFNSADIQRLHDKGIELSLENYQRNYFSSSADIRLSIRPFSGQPTWYSTTLHARIHHAPLPQRDQTCMVGPSQAPSPPIVRSLQGSSPTSCSLESMNGCFSS